MSCRRSHVRDDISVQEISSATCGVVQPAVPWACDLWTSLATTWNKFISTQGTVGVGVLSEVYPLPIEGVVCLQFCYLGQGNGLNQRSQAHEFSGNTLESAFPNPRVAFLLQSQLNRNSQACPEMFRCHLRSEHSLTPDLLVLVPLHMLLNIPIQTLELVNGRHEVHRKADIVAHRSSRKVGVTGPSKRAMNNG